MPGRRCCSRCATISASRATSSSRRAATAPTMPRRSTPSPSRTARRAAWRWSIRRSPRRSLHALHDGGMRGIRFNFLKRLVDDAPKDKFLDVAGRLPAGLARRRLFRGRHPRGAAPVPRRDPGAAGDRPHGPPRRDPGPGRSRHARLPRAARQPPGHHFKATCPDRLDPAGRRRGTLSPRPSRRWSPIIPIACCGAPTGRTRTCRTRSPTTAHLVDMIPRIAPTAELQRKLLVDNPMALYWAD